MTHFTPKCTLKEFFFLRGQIIIFLRALSCITLLISQQLFRSTITFASLMSKYNTYVHWLTVAQHESACSALSEFDQNSIGTCPKSNMLRLANGDGRPASEFTRGKEEQEKPLWSAERLLVRDQSCSGSRLLLENFPSHPPSRRSKGPHAPNPHTVNTHTQ